MRLKLVIIVAAAATLIATLAVALNMSAVDLAKWYYEKSNFTVSDGGPLVVIRIKDDGTVVVEKNLTSPPKNLAEEGRRRAARPANVSDAEASQAVKKAGAEGRLLGTYLFNKTHYVTLVEKGPLEVYAVVWSSNSSAVHKLKFEKYLEDAGNETVRRDGDYVFVKGWRTEGYIDVSGVLPFDVYTFYDEEWGQWNTPLGYYKVAAAGRFKVIYGAAVYVDDKSYYEITDPLLSSCHWDHYSEGSGTLLASVRAHGKAVTPCYPVGTVLDIMADIGYDAWLYRSSLVKGNKYFTTQCRC
ncbi:MAG: hypothetical protein QXP31_08350 [Pyrobaculum sp.]|uniref:hypothetical protein n=1 Tax=Pyrobaculum sp. TaxID=2004705 RepID=UPI0031631537